MMKLFDGDAGEPAPPESSAPPPPPKRGGRRPLGAPDWRPAFLEHLERWGCVALAARHAGVHRSLAYQARAADPGFADGWDEALVVFRERIDRRVHARGLAGSDRCLLAKARAELPEKYGRTEPRPAAPAQVVTIIEVVRPYPRPQPQVVGAAEPSPDALALPPAEGSLPTPATVLASSPLPTGAPIPVTELVVNRPA